MGIIHLVLAAMANILAAVEVVLVAVAAGCLTVAIDAKALSSSVH